MTTPPHVDTELARFDAVFGRIARLVEGADEDGERPALPSTARRITELFMLTPFEVDVLMLAVGVEIDARVRRAVQAGAGGPLPTLGVACARLPEAHWDALAPAGALRRWRLIEIEDRRPLVDAAYCVDECVLAEATGIGGEDPALVGVATLRTDEASTDLPDAALGRAELLGRGGRTFTIAGSDLETRRCCAARISAQLGLGGRVLECHAGTAPDASTVRLIARAALLRAAPVSLALTGPLPVGLSEGLTALGVPLIVLADDAVTGMETVRIGPVTTRALDEQALVDTFIPLARLDDVVVPSRTREGLDDLIAQARQREHLAKAWGGHRGQGVAAMFCGPSGTGKTLAAEAIAAELGCELHIVDLGRTVSKWVGETPKNLTALFARCADDVLLFDEADALFGRRGEVRDGTDRYANLEVAHLLTRIERHRGVTILTTNLAPSIDPAFHRRLDAIIEFPPPDTAGRELLWRRAFPAEIPVAELDIDRLVRLQVTGAVIRSIARRAAVLSAERLVPVDTELVVEAAQKEYRKLGRSLGATERIAS